MSKPRLGRNRRLQMFFMASLAMGIPDSAGLAEWWQGVPRRPPSFGFPGACVHHMYAPSLDLPVFFKTPDFPSSPLLSTKGRGVYPTKGCHMPRFPSNHLLSTKRADAYMHTGGCCLTTAWGIHHDSVPPCTKPFRICRMICMLSFFVYFSFGSFLLCLLVFYVCLPSCCSFPEI